jgi:hypothetical protein
MNRRTFNTLFSSGAVSVAAGAWPKIHAQAGLQTEGGARDPAKWPEGAYRRLLVDTHIPDWDPALLARFDASEYVATVANAGFQSLMQYAKSHVGLCLWRTNVGPLHANMKGRDYFGEVMQECRRRGLHTVAYYSLIFDIWAFDHYPEWRILPENGYDRILEGRPGVVCPNSPYRERALAELRELVGNYDFEGIFLDMTFWPYVCYCPHCSERFRKEYNAEPPRIVNWDDQIWRKFQKARQQWLLDFAMLVTKTIKEVRPVTVTHQYSTIFANWRLGVPLELRDACDFVGGDFYGGPTQYSLVCKAYDGLTARRPFEFDTSRTINLNDFETTKSFKELLTSSCVATLHSAANLIIDSFNPNGTLNPEVYKFLGQQNAKRAPYESFLGGDMLADVAIYYDKESMYDPAENGVHVAEAKGQAPHLSGVTGAARILRQAHIPYGLVTNANLDKLGNFRAVMVPNVLEMTVEQAAQFREFVRKGGVLYASGPTSLDRFHPAGARLLLEDVLGMRYKGTLGTAWTYLSPQDSELKQSIWPQGAISFPGQMIQAEALPEAQVLATVTLPFVDPKVGNCINVRFAQIWNNPPALRVGADPGIVIHPFGQGKAIWLAAPIEAGDYAVNAKVVSALLRRVLPGPYHFEVTTHESVEMTLFHQAEKRRLLVSLLNMEWQLAPIGLGATVRVQLPSGREASSVLRLPERAQVQYRKAGPYVEFRIEPFDTLAMALVEYA